ncbi:hypothetical protein Pelo_3737 [Pelomyxa schiedti]|nr:hypothetical protein Pelo_3737 [Pelomyxa schiedti]
MVQKITQILQEDGIILDMSQGAKALVAHSVEPRLGARQVQLYLEDKVVTEISEMRLKKQLPANCALQITTQDEGSSLVFSIQTQPAHPPSTTPPTTPSSTASLMLTCLDQLVSPASDCTSTTKTSCYL